MTSDDREPELLAVERLNPVLQRSANWPHGQLRSLTVERIGLEFGLSGRSHLVTVMTESGEIAHLVAKFETAESIARAVGFRRQNERALSDFIPAFYGAVFDDGSADGVILLEYVHPAEQGDVLIGTTEMRALDLMRTMGRLHGHTWQDAGQDAGLQFQWAAEAWKQSRWMDRLVRAHERYPEVISESHVDRLTGFPSEVAAAITELKTGPHSWIHHDPHLDNVLWRPSGTPVLLDWSGAVIGPPGVDVSVLLLDLAFGAGPSLSPEELLSTYHEVVVGSVVTVERHTVGHTGRLALFPLLQGIVGWAGRVDDPPPTGRSRALRDHSIAAAVRALTWLDVISTVGR